MPSGCCDSASPSNVNVANLQLIDFAGDDEIVDLRPRDNGLSDTVLGSSVRDRIESGAGNDTLNGASGNDIIDGGDGTTSSTAAPATIFCGGVGNDTITGGTGADRMSGEAGNDLFIYEANAAVAGEVADGGGGIDTIRVAGSNSFKVGSLSGIERFQFAGAATLTCSAASNDDFSFFGDGNINKISILFARATTLSMEGFTFAGWATTDPLSLTGSAAGDTVTGSAVADTINGTAAAT